MRLDYPISAVRPGLVLLLVAGLAGCSSSITRDWPEQPTAVTGQRPSQGAGQSGTVIGSPGNPPFYEVFGRRYYVMPTADGFRERGVASWYGPDFHGKPTSGGEIYDMHARTAAHKTLPIPTWLEVTNLENGRQVIVRVNDRGPFVGDRVIDLSYQAAKDLDMIGAGTARVQLRALGTPVGGSGDPAPSPPVQAARSPTPRSSGFALISTANAEPVAAGGRADEIYVQVGAFSDRDNALGLVTKLKRSGFENTFVLGGGADSLYRVRIGPLADERQFDRVRDDLRRVGVGESRLVSGSP